jgi:hypothetical protein
MKLRLWIVPFLSLLLAGCGIGGFWMEGISGQAREEYLKSIKPYAHYWVKEGVTVEEKRRDSWACGAAPTIIGADGPIFTDEQIKAAKHPEEQHDIAAVRRLEDAWGKCMRSKGYGYRRDAP